MLGALLGKRFPRLAAQLRTAEVPLGDISASWFGALFVTSLPPETAARVWDVLALEGPKVLFRVALALFKVRAPARHPILALLEAVCWHKYGLLSARVLVSIGHNTQVPLLPPHQGCPKSLLMSAFLAAQLLFTEEIAHRGKQVILQ